MDEDYTASHNDGRGRNRLTSGDMRIDGEGAPRREEEPNSDNIWSLSNTSGTFNQIYTDFSTTPTYSDSRLDFNVLIQERDSRIQQLETQILSLKEDLQRQFRLVNESQTRHQHFAIEAAADKKQISRLESENKDLSKKLQQVSTSAKNVLAFCDKLRQKEKEAENAKQSMVQEMEATRLQLVHMSKELETAKAEAASLKSQLEDMRVVNEASQGHISSLEKETQELREVKDTAPALVSDANCICSTLRRHLPQITASRLHQLVHRGLQLSTPKVNIGVETLDVATCDGHCQTQDFIMLNNSAQTDLIMDEFVKALSNHQYLAAATPESPQPDSHMPSMHSCDNSLEARRTSPFHSPRMSQSLTTLDLAFERELSSLETSDRVGMFGSSSLSGAPFATAGPSLDTEYRSPHSVGSQIVATPTSLTSPNVNVSTNANVDSSVRRQSPNEALDSLQRLLDQDLLEHNLEKNVSLSATTLGGQTRITRKGVRFALDSRRSDNVSKSDRLASEAAQASSDPAPSRVEDRRTSTGSFIHGGMAQGLAASTAPAEGGTTDFPQISGKRPRDQAAHTQTPIELSDESSLDNGKVKKRRLQNEGKVASDEINSSKPSKLATGPPARAAEESASPESQSQPRIDSKEDSIETDPSPRGSAKSQPEATPSTSSSAKPSHGSTPTLQTLQEQFEDNSPARLEEAVNASTPTSATAAPEALSPEEALLREIDTSDNLFGTDEEGAGQQQGRASDNLKKGSTKRVTATTINLDQVQDRLLRGLKSPSATLKTGATSSLNAAVPPPRNTAPQKRPTRASSKRGQQSAAKKTGAKKVVVPPASIESEPVFDVREDSDEDGAIAEQ